MALYKFVYYYYYYYYYYFHHTLSEQRYAVHVHATLHSAIKLPYVKMFLRDYTSSESVYLHMKISPNANLILHIASPAEGL